MSYEFRIGVRYLLSRKHNALLSLITTISVVGVALGVTALTVVLSVVSGFEEEFQRKILGNNAPLILFRVSGPILEYDEVGKKIESVNGVKAQSPFLYSEVLLHSDSGRSAGVVLYGIDPKKVSDVTSITKDVVSGNIQDLLGKEGNLPPILVGHELAENNLVLFPGSTVDVVAPAGELTPFGFGPKVRRFNVVGVFKSGLYEYDAKSAYVSLTDAQRFFGRPGEASGIQISVKDIKSARAVGRQVQETVGERYYVRHWLEMNRDLFAAFKLEKTTFFIVLTMIVLVASFNIVGTLTLLVMTKGREISILKAMGATRRSIAKIFMVSGTLVGALGTGVGLFAGLVLCILLEKYVHFPLNADVYQLDTLPVRMRAIEFVLVGVSAMIISFFATLYPSLRAARLDPAEGLRYE
ncbi:MAG TPA: ABC transporter permease [Bdellovibrionota bacterium]|nr:ABC transporter permease [Bdellovibrionota bacterium]